MPPPCFLKKRRKGDTVKLNWKLRLQNKTTLLAILLGAISLIYQVLGMLDIVPAISESQIVQLVSVAIDLLVLMGVVIDPTTKGISDSEQAMQYDEPRA